MVGIGHIACVKAYIESIFIGRHDPENVARRIVFSAHSVATPEVESGLWREWFIRRPAKYAVTGMKETKRPQVKRRHRITFRTRLTATDHLRPTENRILGNFEP